LKTTAQNRMSHMTEPAADVGRGDALALNFIIIWFFGDLFSFFG
jgi:hypothetical protein